MGAVPEPLWQSCPVLAFLWSVPPAEEGAEKAASTATLQGTPHGAPAATGLPSKSPSAPLPPSLSSYAKQLISPISSQAPSLIVHQ